MNHSVAELIHLDPRRYHRSSPLSQTVVITLTKRSPANVIAWYLAARVKGAMKQTDFSKRKMERRLVTFASAQEPLGMRNTV